MPDHFHALVWFVAVGSEHNQPPKDNQKVRGTRPQSLEVLVQNFKSVTGKRINQVRRTPGMRVWQRNYYEHVVRDEQDLENIRRYIRDNPHRQA